MKSSNSVCLKLFSVVTLLFLMGACSPTVQVTGSWKTPTPPEGKKFKKIFVLAITSNGELRSTLENDLSEAAIKRGYEVIRSEEAFPRADTGNVVVKKEDILNKALEMGCDGILTFAVLSQSEQSRYVPGMYAYNPVSYGFYDMFAGYYTYMAPVVYSPGYYSTDKYYFMESNFFDTVEGKLLWSVQSESVNPSNIKKFSKTYTNTLLEQLKQEHIVK